MNYINKLASFAVLVTALSGCDFNEDFCIRNGELVAWCDFSGIKEPLPIPAQRHMIAFPLGHTDIPLHRIPFAGVFPKVNTASCSIQGITK